MADAAAFFANKKKKKKAFKFNANKIDASTVTQTVHVDAPALSNASAPEPAPAVSNVENASPDANETSEQWDDEALAATMGRKGAVANNATSELLDMKALDLKSNEQDDIQEKLRVEETKAKLAAAREGMEKEAQRIKEEREKKETEQQANVAPRFGAAAAGMGMGGGKWVPPHMRGGGGMVASRLPGASGKLDTQDENLFPDLASADAIIEQQKHNQPAYKVPKKTPVGGGATWGDRPKLNLERKKNVESPPEPTPPREDKPAPEESAAPPTETKEAASEPSTETAPETQAPAPAAAAKAPIKPKKKKKKDLSTFKASS